MALHRAVMVYQSSDGKQHRDLHKADQATCDHLCSVLDKLLAPLAESGHLSASDRYRAVSALAGDSARVATLCKQVAPILNWIIENAEDQED